MRRNIFTLLLLLSLASPARAQVAFDAATNGDSTSYSHTTGSGSDRAILVLNLTLDHATTFVRYAGVDLTRLGQVATSGLWIELWGLLGPSTGANNVTSDGNVFCSSSVTYSGVGAFEATTTNTSSSSTSLTISATVATDQSWIAAAFRNDSSDGNAGTSTTKRTSSGGRACNLMDSNAAKSTGSQSVQATLGGTANWGGVITALAPAGGGGGSSAPSGLMLRGVK